MDRPNGPRQPPPDKRHAAYESIFGRPGINHPVPSNNYLNYQPELNNRRSSQPPLRQSIYHQPPPPLPPNHYPQLQYPQQYPHYHQQNVIPQSNPSLSRARSINPNAHPQSNPYLTPAQAYQSQLYSNAPASSSSHSVWSGSPGAPVPIATSHASNASIGSHSPAGSQHFNGSDIYSPPRLGVSLEHDDGRLGIDFTSTDGGSSSDLANDESELPWARSEPTIHTRQSNTSKHSREPSLRGQPTSNPPLHVDTAMPHSTRSSLLATSPSPSSNADHSSASTTLLDHNYMPRRSSDSARTAPKFPTHRKDRSIQDRSMSMPSAPNPARSILEQQKRVSKPSFGSSVSTLPVEGRVSPAHNPSNRTPVIRKSQNIYPALLSRVAQAFRERIPICDRVKDGLTYKDAFDGREAVDKIAYIIKTTDRNLALLLGRALDAQKFFHDVTYDHRLRDSANELYQFRTKLPSPFVSGELPQQEPSPESLVSGVTNALFHPEGENGSTSPTPTSPHRRSRADSISSDEAPLPSGVFTLLTDCYSPTCSRDQLCYSIACPRRLEQQARLNMKPQPGLSKQISKDSLNDLPDDGTLWIHSVPQEIVNSVSDTEKKRQEAINEVIYTERDFVRDMEYLRDVWINRLQEEDIIPAHKRTDFLAQVFWNVHDIIAVNTRLRDALTRRQKSYAVVDKLGDLLLEAVPHFGPFVSYGAHQLYGKYEFEKEKSTNPAFAQFVEATERLPESRKLELNAYLTKPTTRLARYPLLLEAVLKHTPNDSPDKQTLPQVITLVREFLAKVNAESGKTENRFNLLQLEQQLVFKPGEEVNLRLSDEGREMVYKGALNKRDGEIHVYLFDHALLFTKLSKTKQHEHYKVYRRPIPLELLHVVSSAPDDSVSASGTIRSQQRSKQALARRSSFERNKGVPHVVSTVTLKGDKGQPVIIFTHLGRKYQVLQLYASSPLIHKKWLEMIYKQQQIMRDRTMIFDTVTLSEGFFHGPNKVNCAAPYSGGRRVVYGTDDGVYLSDMLESGQEPVKVLALLDVMQVDVLEDYQLLIVLSERQVITFPLDALDPLDPMAGLKRAKRISSHTSFFKAGFCLGRVLVCIVKSSQLSSTFKTLEPIDQNIRGRAKPTFKKLLNGGNDTLKMFKEFYIPVESTSIHYLKTKLCVGCSRGFEIVNLESLDTQGLLDPQDESLEFVRKRDNLRPMAIYRIGNDFLLCYDEFAFYVNRNGRRSRKDFMIFWEGSPTGFALYEPFVIAVEPTFVEIRHIDTGLMSQVIQGSNLRLLFADTPPSVTIQSSASPQNPYLPAGPAYGNPYSPHGNPYGHSNHPFPTQQHYPDQYPRHPQGVGRQEILIVSDDRVLSLQPHANIQNHSQRYMSDNISMASSAR